MSGCYSCPCAMLLLQAKVSKDGEGSGGQADLSSIKWNELGSTKDGRYVR